MLVFHHSILNQLSLILPIRQPLPQCVKDRVFGAYVTAEAKARPTIDLGMTEMTKAQSQTRETLMESILDERGENLSNNPVMTQGKLCLALQPDAYDWVLVEKRKRKYDSNSRK